MKHFIALLSICLLIACKDYKPGTSGEPKQTFIQSLRKQASTARLLLHHQVQKKSLIIGQTTSPLAIDTFFSYIGPEEKLDTNCVFSHYGEIQLFTDSLNGRKLATLYIIPSQKCHGIYIASGSKIRKYVFLPAGQTFFKELDRQYYSSLH